jgi:hypothetical protein
MTIALRTTIEALLLGTAGSTRTMAADRFHLRAPDGALEDHPSNAAERTIEVVIDSPVPLDGFNGLDSSVLYVQRMTIRIRYLMTGAGGDMTEGLTEQSGGATIDLIRDRANTDAHAINVVLNWHENYSGTDPRIVNIVPDGPPSGPVTQGDRAILELPFTMTTQATMPGSSYSP